MTTAAGLEAAATATVMEEDTTSKEDLTEIDQIDTTMMEEEDQDLDRRDSTTSEMRTEEAALISGTKGPEEAGHSAVALSSLWSACQ